MSTPVLLVVDADADSLRRLDHELRDRYGRHYRVSATGSTTEGCAVLEELAAAGAEVASSWSSAGTSMSSTPTPSAGS